MAKRNLIDRLIPINDIIEPLELIDNSETDYITPSGKVYKDYGNNMMFPKSCFINKVNGYVYCNITTIDGQRQRRVHILVAKAFIPNPNNFPYVGHKDNNKGNPNIDNLYWTTASENTQKAFADGLAKNAKGFEDSQSMPVCAFTLNKDLYKIYGSVGECANELHITKSGILYQCNHKLIGKPRKGYYFRFLSEYNSDDFVL